MSKISFISAAEVLNSRAEWTLKVSLATEHGFVAESYLPLGRSRSAYERPLPSLPHLCQFISEKLPQSILGKSVEDFREVDAILQNLTAAMPELGNSLLPVSTATVKLAAKNQNLPLWKYLRESVFRTRSSEPALPLPFVTLFMGGLHKYPFLEKALPVENFQVIQLVLEAPTILDCIRLASDVYRRLSLRLMREGCYRGIGQDGGIAFFNEDALALDWAWQETKACLETLPEAPPFGFAVDVAASHLKVGNKYRLVRGTVDEEGMFQYISGLVQRFPIWSIEDPFHVDDKECWQRLRAAFPNLQIVGDDAFVASPERLTLNEYRANGVILKPDYLGTVSEIRDLVATAAENRMSVVVSHRSGETCDTFIADLAAAFEPIGDFNTALRAGAPYCGERVAKWNRLMEIERETGRSRCTPFRRESIKRS